MKICAESDQKFADIKISAELAQFQEFSFLKSRNFATKVAWVRPKIQSELGARNRKIKTGLVILLW